jgi:ribosome-associated translation inhibitor RaiA
MKIHVADIARTFGRQTRAYAEYRIFSSLARFSDVVREAAVSLAPAGRGHSVVCSVVVGFEMGSPVRVTARGRHAYDAINRVAHRIGPAVRRHTHAALQSSESNPELPTDKVRRK